MSDVLKKSIFIFSILLVFTSFEMWMIEVKEFKGNGYEVFVYNIFMKPIFGGFLSFLELFFFFILYKIIHSTRQRSRAWSWQERYIFWGAVVCLILRILNPNNNPSNPVFGLPLISDITYFGFLIILWVVFSLTSVTFLKYIEYFLYCIIVASVIRGGVLFIFWFMGRGQDFFGYFSSILMESDSLYFYAFLEVFSLGLYLLFPKRKYLFLFLFFLLIEILSFRRSALFAALIGNFITILLFLFEKKKIYFKVFILVITMGAIFLAMNIEFLPLPENVKFLYLRYANALPWNETGTGILSDSGHWQQSQNVTESALSDLGFWGSGYGNVFYLRGQSEGTVHNFYIAVWAKYGFYMLLYYLGIIFIMGINLIKTLFSKVHDEYERLVRFYSLILNAFLIGYFIALTTNTYLDVETFKMRFLWALIIAAILKITPEAFRTSIESRQVKR
jgi:hypothetical protein